MLTEKQEELLDALLPLAGYRVGVLEEATRPRGFWPNQRPPTLREVVDYLVAATELT